VTGGGPRRVLVVAGEPSGDRIAALVAAELAAEGVSCTGIGGAACRAAGVETFVDMASIAAMGVADVIGRAPRLAAALGRLAAHVLRDPPRAALLVNFTELNQHLGRLLRARGTRVLWCVAPQVWAWRPGRLSSLRGAMDRIAVILPFEAPLWRAAGHDAVYVGHPSAPARDTAGSAPRRDTAPSLAILPGSRPGEIARLADPFFRAATSLLASGAVASARVLVAPDLPQASRTLLGRLSRASGLPLLVTEGGALPHLAAFSASLCASGTASLECALAGAAPVVAYRLDPLAFALARRLVRTPHIALPNVLLNRRAYPELLQDEATPAKLAAAARVLLDRRDESLRLAAELHAILAPPSPALFGRRVAELLIPWLD
jgi:lipid-A-disaccharide synthase